jgi:hypothetical protein
MRIITEKAETLGIQYCRFEERRESTDYVGIIEYKIFEFCRKIENSKQLEFVISFHVPKKRQQQPASFLWNILSTPFDDKAVFEKWRIPVRIASPSAPHQVQNVQYREEAEIASSRKQIIDRMFDIIRKINDRMDHLPPPPTDQIVYNFDIHYSPYNKAGRDTAGPPGSPIWSPRSIAQSIRSIPFIT